MVHCVRKPLPVRGQEQESYPPGDVDTLYAVKVRKPPLDALLVQYLQKIPKLSPYLSVKGALMCSFNVCMLSDNQAPRPFFSEPWPG